MKENIDRSNACWGVYSVRCLWGDNQKEFADRVGISQSMVNKIENRQTVPSMKTLQKIADKCRVSIDQLLMRQPIDRYSFY